MKRSRRFLSILLTLSLLVAMLIPMASPAAAAGLTMNYADSEVNYSDSADEGTFGNMIIKETTDFQDIFTTSKGVVITFTFPDGVEFKTPSSLTFGNLTSGSTGISGSIVGTPTETSVTLKVYGTNGGSNDVLIVDFGTLTIDDDFTGDVKVDVTSLESKVTEGQYVIGHILGDDNVVTVLSKKDLDVGQTGVKTGTFRITESAKGSLRGGEITVTLPDGLEFNSSPVAVSGTLSGVVKKSEITDEDELTITLYTKDEFSYDGRGFLDLTFTVDVDYDAEVGDYEIEIEGDSTNDVPDTTLVAGKIQDFGTTVSVKSVKTINAGKWAKELDEVKIKSDAKDSVVKGRYIIAELSGNAKFAYASEADVPTSTGLKCTDESDTKLVWKVEDAKDEYTLKKLEIGTRIGATGDVVLKFSGTAGVQGEVKVAEVVAPVDASVEKATEVKIGVQSQSVGDVIVKENKAGAIMDETKSYDSGSKKWVDYTPATLILQAPDGADFASRPTAEVIEGDLKLDNSSLVYLKDSDSDGLYDQVYVEIDKASKTASAVKFSNIKLSVNRSFPEGPLTIKVKGGAVVDPRSAESFNSSNAATVAVANVVTPAPQAETGGMFMIGSNFYNIGGQMKMMDAAPYIKSGRTYVPVRYLAYTCGLSDSDIAWDEATQTVTLTKGDKVVKLVIGSTNINVDGTDTAMDVAPEISNGRTMLPARYVAEAFGATVTWNAATKAVGIEF